MNFIEAIIELDDVFNAAHKIMYRASWTENKSLIWWEGIGYRCMWNRESIRDELSSSFEPNLSKQDYLANDWIVEESRNFYD